MGPFDGAAAPQYAVHTDTCTYVLDDEGICRWIMARQGAVPPHVQQCVGAQFVACLDLSSEGGLIGELRRGAMGLFVRTTAEGRMMLLRTAPIMRVDVPGETLGALPGPSGQARYGDPFLYEAVEYGKRAGVPLHAPPAVSFAQVESWGSEQTVTVTKPKLGGGR
jgi:hypothetical protein